MAAAVAAQEGKEQRWQEPRGEERDGSEMQDTVKLPAESLIPGPSRGGWLWKKRRQHSKERVEEEEEVAVERTLSTTEDGATSGYLSCLLVYEIQHCYLAPPESFYSSLSLLAPLPGPFCSFAFS